MLLHRPSGDVLVKVIGRVGEGREDEYLAVALIDGISDFSADVLFETTKLLVSIDIDLPRLSEQPGEDLLVLPQILFPSDEIHILQKHLDLGPDEVRVKVVVVEIDVLDAQFLDFGDIVAIDSLDKIVHLAEQLLQCLGKRMDGTLHSLEKVYPHQVDEALLSVELLE
jgi:hypothetical protein